jgi:hypothetical protein
MTAPAADFDAIVAYLQGKYRQAQHLDPEEPGPVLAPDYDLIDSRVIDSLEFVEFILLVEEHSGREISIDELSREDFRTLESIRKRFFDDA